jgi:hypothetical protein
MKKFYNWFDVILVLAFVVTLIAIPAWAQPQPTLVHESYSLSRLDTHHAGERHWIPINTFHLISDASTAYAAAVTTYGATEVRMERRTVEVMQGPVK